MQKRTNRNVLIKAFVHPTDQLVLVFPQMYPREALPCVGWSRCLECSILGYGKWHIYGDKQIGYMQPALHEPRISRCETRA